MYSHDVVVERGLNALRYLNETPDVEFKRSQPYLDVQYRIAKAAQALANLPDGGFIIVGVRQENKVFHLDGITEEHAATYVTETIYDFVNAYASPPIEIRKVELEFEDSQYIGIFCPPFARSPIVCRKNTPDGVSKRDEMREGTVYVRTSAPVGTSMVKSAPMMDELLNRATTLRVAQTLSILRDGGVALNTLVPTDALSREVADLAQFL